VDPRAGLDAVAKKRNPWPYWEWNSGHPARRSVTILTELPLRASHNSGVTSCIIVKMQAYYDKFRTCKALKYKTKT
jgi:hypothetical protein